MKTIRIFYELFFKIGMVEKLDPSPGPQDPGTPGPRSPGKTYNAQFTTANIKMLI